jgi:hypothetical protein
VNPAKIQQLVEDYRKTSLYLAMHAQIMARIAKANTEPANDPHVVMRLRGKVEAYTEILSHGFLNACAIQAATAQEVADVAPANPPMHPDDLAWWATDRNDLVM